MNTNDAFDYQAHYQHTKPDPERLEPSVLARDKRRQTIKQRITIRLDQNIVEQFKALSGDDGYQTLINQALREWLDAQSVKELLRQELPKLVQDAQRPTTAP